MIDERDFDESNELFPGENFLLEDLKYSYEDSAMVKFKLSKVYLELSRVNYEFAILYNELANSVISVNDLDKINARIEMLKAELLIFEKQLFKLNTLSIRVVLLLKMRAYNLFSNIFFI